jgi:uncharacterized membrane protein YebE (DUF533 family)
MVLPISREAWAMSMKRILGMMLASRMGGRGGGALGGGLGGLAAAGMLGGRRGGLGRKAGLAALGYMAYRAYQDRQAGAAGGETAGATGGTGSASGGGGLSGGIGGLLKTVGDAFAGSRDARTGPSKAGAPSEPPASSEAAFTPEDERAAETFSEDTALLLVRAMVAAANADGSISAAERARILAQADEGHADPEDRRVLERELDNPRPVEELLGQVRDRETAEEFYLASRMALDDKTEAHRAYLARVRERLGLDEQEAAEIDNLAT